MEGSVLFLLRLARVGRAPCPEQSRPRLGAERWLRWRPSRRLLRNPGRPAEFWGPGRGRGLAPLSSELGFLKARIGRVRAGTWWEAVEAVTREGCGVLA